MDSSNIPTPQLNIIQYLYRFRFLTSHQISQLLQHKNIRLTNYHLKVLTSNNYIDKHYTRSLTSANQPAIYYLSSASIKLLEGNERVDKRALKRIYREKVRSQAFVDHCLFIASYYLFLRQESNKTNYTLHFFTKTDLLAHSYVIHPLPDAYFARVNSKGEIKRYFVEIVEDSSPRFALRKRIEQYSDYIEDERFEETTGHSFPTILFICPGFASLIYLKKHLERIYDETSLDQTEIYLATREEAFSGSWTSISPDDE
jgi:hypothetical protein